MAVNLTLSIEDVELRVPEFARLSDYLGLWCIEPVSASALRNVVTTVDLFAHVKSEGRNDDNNKRFSESVPDRISIPGGKKIAVVNLSGILMKPRTSLGGTSTVQARREVRAATNDPDVAGILYQVDSPGGTSAGTEELAQEVRAAAKKKPSAAQVDDLGASAAVWAISGVHRIYASTKTTLYGSIGTYQVVYDTSEMHASSGVRTLLIATGPLKGMGTAGTKFTDEQLAHAQSLVDAIQGPFDDAVRTGRGLSAKQLAAVRHGGVVPAAAAVESGLIDGIQSLNRTIDAMVSAIKTGEWSRQRSGSLPTLSGARPRSFNRLPMLQGA